MPIRSFLLTLLMALAASMTTGCASGTVSLPPNLPSAPANLATCAAPPILSSPDMGSMLKNHLATVSALNDCRQKLKSFNEFYREQRVVFAK